jgi:hypothetical protein
MRFNDRWRIKAAALVALIALPVQVLAADLELGPAPKSSQCETALLAHVRDRIESNRMMRRLHEKISSLPSASRENSCLRIKQSNLSELKDIREFEARAGSCGLQREKLEPLMADHRETVRLMNQECSQAYLGKPLPDILQFDNYKMPPFPE